MSKIKRSKSVRKSRKFKQHRPSWNWGLLEFVLIGLVVFSVLATVFSFVLNNLLEPQEPQHPNLWGSAGFGGILGACIGVLTYCVWIHRFSRSTHKKLPYLRPFFKVSFIVLCICLVVVWILVPIAWAFLKLLTDFDLDLNFHLLLIVSGIIPLVAAMVGGGISVAVLWMRNRFRYGDLVLAAFVGCVIFALLALSLSNEDGRWGSATIGGLLGIIMASFIYWAWRDKTPKWLYKEHKLFRYTPRSALIFFALSMFMFIFWGAFRLSSSKNGALPFELNSVEYLALSVLVSVILAGLVGSFLFCCFLILMSEMSDRFHKITNFLIGIAGATLICIWPLLLSQESAHTDDFDIITSSIIIPLSGILLVFWIDKREKTISRERKIKDYKIPGIDVFMMSIAFPGILVTALNNESLRALIS